MDIQAYIQSGVIESYVLGVADPQDVAELQRLQQEHPEIATAIEACERWLHSMAQQNAVPPAKDLEQKVFSIWEDGAQPLLNNQSTASAVTTTSQKASAAPVRKLSGYVAAASIILFLASAGVALYFYNHYKRTVETEKSLLAEQKKLDGELEKLRKHLHILANPGIIKVPMPGIKGHEDNLVTLYWEPQTKNVYLIANKLPQAPQGKQYQLWALVNGKPVDAGLLDNCQDLCQLKQVQEAQAFAITLEKTGGSPVPSLDQLYVMGNIKL